MLFLKKVHATTITKKHIQVGSAKVYDIRLRHFPYLGSAHHSTSVLVFISFDVRLLSSSMFSLLHLRRSFYPHSLTISVSIASLIFSLMFDTPALALKAHATNLIYPGIIGQQASRFEVWFIISPKRYFHVHQKWRDAISDKQVNTEKQTHSWSHRKICTQNNQCHQWWYSHTVYGSLAKEPCNKSLTTLSRMLWAKRKMVAYTWWWTLREVRRLHHQRNHSHSLSNNNVQLVHVNVETQLAQK